MAWRSGLSLPAVDDWTPPRSLKVATGSESSGDEFGILEDGRCVDTGVFQQRCLVHELGFRLTAALADQLHSPDSSRVVCHSRSGPVPTGSPPSSSGPRGWNPVYWHERRSVLNGAWNAALRYASGTARRPLSEVVFLVRLYAWRFKRQNKSERAISDRLAATLNAQQPFHSNLPSEDDKPFLPRFLLQEIIFAHSP